ncbi:hypothetical protein Zmor_008047 [Zophobas morio]|uniref:RWD domain-containing protein n=1 Tax=Zophobas morio TaxID=2755281 RepID=A0AA38IVF5_9CUCU|nr:hypothetical protein Zmor_008047 [Zophobas morio]
MDNLAEQCEEIEALKSIYDNKWKLEPATNCYSIQITPNVKLFITLNENYPSTAPPNFELLAPTLTVDQKQQVTDEFQEIYESNMGGPILFQWVEKLKEIAEIETPAAETTELETSDVELIVSPAQVTQLSVTHGEVIQDRKSAFQGHASPVFSLEDTKVFINHLLENKKISQATHNIVAYRILTPKGTVLQDCDDDGESHAGSRVLHLLQIRDLTNVMVVVSRWYGGIHLGPDRFKHINNAARQVLLQGGFLQS